MKLLGAVWYTPRIPFVVLDGPRSGLCVGFIAIEVEDGWKCYMGYGLGVDERYDAERIAKTGAKVTKEVAVAHFPHLDPEKYVP